MNRTECCARQVQITTVLRRDNGFTLIEMLLNFSIAVVILTLFPLIIQNIMVFKSVSSDNYDINYELCLRDILSEIKGKELSVLNGQLLAKDSKSGKTYSYLYNQSRIVRKVDGSGYVILQEKVRQAVFTKNINGIFLDITWQDSRRVRHEIVQID